MTKPCARWRIPRSRGVLAQGLAALAFLFAAACQIPGSAELQAARSARAGGDLAAAHQFYEQALALNPRDPNVTTELAALRAELTSRAIERANAIAADGSGPALRKGIAELDAAQQFDPQRRYLSDARRQLQGRLNAVSESSNENLLEARAALDANRFERVAQLLGDMRTLDDRDPRLAALKLDYQTRYGDHLSARLEAQLSDQDVTGARQTLSDLAEVLPPSRLVETRRTFAEQELVWLRRQVDQETAANRYYSAYQLVLDSGRGEDLDADLSKLRANGARFYESQARQRLERGETARAYIEAFKATELDDTIAGLFETHRDARDAELAKLQSYLAITTFGSPSTHPDAGAYLSDVLINRLFELLPFGVRLVDREEIDALVRDGSSFAEIGVVLNVDLIVSGNVSLLEVDRQERTQQGIARVKVGTRPEANPAYQAAVDAGRRRNLPPATIDSPVYETLRYQKGVTTAKGFGTVSMRLFDAARASIVAVEEFTTSTEVSDEFQDAVAGTEIEGDPLELPTDTEILSTLRLDLANQMIERVVEQFGKRERFYLERVRERLDRRESELALESLASGLLYCVRAKVAETDTDQRALREFLISEAESDFL